MMGTYADYSTELTDEERALGFEVVELQECAQQSCHQCEVPHAVAYRFTDTDQIAKLNVPVIGGSSYRHERLSQAGGPNTPTAWVPVNSIVFPTARQAVSCISGGKRQVQYCH